MSRAPDAPPAADDDGAVAGGGRSPEDPAGLRDPGVLLSKLELWNSRSSRRSVWPRSP
jgi:hypothetical protein